MPTCSDATRTDGLLISLANRSHGVQARTSRPQGGDDSEDEAIFAAQRSYAPPRGLTAVTTITLASWSRRMIARQSPMRRRHSPRLPLRLRTSPEGRRSIVVRMRSLSLRGSLRRAFAAAGATTASHGGSSGARFGLRAQLGHGDRLALPIGRPALV